MDFIQAGELPTIVTMDFHWLQFIQERKPIVSTPFLTLAVDVSDSGLDTRNIEKVIRCILE